MYLNPNKVIEMFKFDTIINNEVVHVTCQYKRTRYLKIKLIGAKNLLLIVTKKTDLKEAQSIIDKYRDTIVKMLSKPKIELSNDDFIIFGKTYHKADYSKKEIDSMYKDAILSIKKMFYDIKEKNKFPNVELYFRKMHSRWGVCYSKEKRIGLSSYLVFVPCELIEYVILHEFCHLKHADHSALFYAELDKYCPKHRQFKKDLKYYSSLL